MADPKSPEEQERLKGKELPDNNTDQLDLSKFPDGTVSIIIKNKDKVLSTGLTLPTIDQNTPDEDLVMALQRIRDVSNRLINTVYYTLANRPQDQDLPTLEG